ncbi:MAG: TlpA family protein disulfide reductase [Alphaproteobacteria bacterium]|nr:TlpA family protein disulfide reductase [Alphaproteobacteria bacterium]
MSFWKKKDNLIITGFVVTFFIALGVWYKGVPFTPNSASASAFDIPFVSQNQQQLTLNKFKGKPLVVNFWATWCSVCVKKMGTLNRFAGKFQAEGGEVIAISQDRGGLSAVQSYYARNAYNNLAIYLEPSGQLATAFGVQGFPTSIFIDAQGKEVGRIAGGIDYESDDINELIKRYFGMDLS